MGDLQLKEYVLCVIQRCLRLEEVKNHKIIKLYTLYQYELIFFNINIILIENIIGTGFSVREKNMM